MLDWLRGIDDSVFSPPHRFETILAFVVVRLGLVFEHERDERSGQEPPSKEAKRGREPKQERS